MGISADERMNKL